jgi:TolB protein
MINRVRFPTSSDTEPPKRMKHSKTPASKSCQGPPGRKVECIGAEVSPVSVQEVLRCRSVATICSVKRGPRGRTGPESRGAFVMTGFGRWIGFLGLVAGTAGVVAPASASAATPAASVALPSLVAYVRGGGVYVSRGAAETRLTTGGGYARPRWSPDGKQLAVLRNGQLWTMRADGSAPRRLTTRPAAGPSWSPDGKWLAFSSLSCSGGPGVYRISAGTAAASPQVLFPAECRDQPLPAEQPVAAKQSGSLTDRLAVDDAVAWSPDGGKVAFRGGDCDSVYDACLSVGTVTTGSEKTIAAYGGGSLETSGFAVVPSWRADGAKLAFTAYQKGETTADDQPVHLVEYDTTTGAKRTVGGTLDREMAYVDAARGVATGQHAGGSWIVVVGLADGSRTLLHAGSQPSVQPVPAAAASR